MHLDVELYEGSLGNGGEHLLEAHDSALLLTAPGSSNVLKERQHEAAGD